jgi:Yip1 domain
MSDATLVPPAALVPGPEPSAVGRVVGALFSPGETFASIARRPTFLLPLLLWMGLSLGITAVILPKFDWEKMTRDRMEKSGQTVTDENVERGVAQAKKFGGVFAYCIAVISPWVVALVTAVVIWGSFKAFGWDSTFKQAMGATAHAFLPGVVKAVLLLVLVWRQDVVDPQAMGELVRSNLGFLGGSDSPKALHALFLSIDVFSFWSLWLFVIGFAAAAKVKRGSAAGVIVTLWVIVTAIGVGWKAFF